MKKYPQRRIMLLFYVLAAITVFFFVALGIASVSKADIAVFYPTSCLGGWENPSHAEHEPETTSESPETFTKQNSAVLHNNLAQIFCGEFKGEIPQGTVPSHVILKLSWAALEQQESSATNIDGERFSSSTNTIIDLPSSDGGQFNIDVPSASESAPPTDAATPESSSESKPTPAPEPVSAPEPAPAPQGDQSFFRLFVGTAYAEEIPIVETTSTPAHVVTSTDLVQLAPDQTASVIDTLSSTTISAPAATSTEEISIQAVPLASDEPFLEVLYTVDGVTWESLGTVTKTTLASTHFEIPASAFSGWEDLSKLQVSVQRLSTINEAPAVYLDGMKFEIDYDKTVEVRTVSPEELEGLPRVDVEGDRFFKYDKNDFRANEKPEFEVVPAESPQAYGSPEKTTKTLATHRSVLGGFLQKIIHTVFADDEPLDLIGVDVFDPRGKKSGIKPIIRRTNGGLKIDFSPNAQPFLPGKYRIVVDVLQDNKILTSTQEFTWGVLAVNTSKATYAPDDSVILQMAALNESGHTLCNARLELSITNTGQGVAEVFSTENGGILKSNTCGPNNVTDEPDYTALFTARGPGTYTVRLKNLDAGYEISDSFLVENAVPYDITRTAATRINPFKADYTMKISVTARQNFSGSITESLPKEFTIVSATSSLSSATQILPAGTRQNLVWNVDLKKGEIAELAYVYSAPEVSPQFYLLGPLKMAKYSEARQWQIASDNACQTTSATGNWNDSTKWTSCGSTFPGSGDSVTILTGHVITVNTNSAASSVTINAPAATNGITISGTNTLTVGGGTGTITFNSSATLATSSVAVGAGALSAGTVTLAGATSIAQLSMSTGTSTITGNVTFSGTATKAKVTFTGNGTLKLTGDFGAGGTIEPTGTNGNIDFNGTGAQTMNTYRTYQKIQISNTSNTVTLGGAASTTNFTINANASFSNGANLLTIAGNYVNNGTHGGTGGTYMSGTSMTLDGNGTVTNTGTFSLITAAKSFNSTSLLTFNGPLAIVGAISITNNGSTTVRNSMTGSAAGSTWVNAANSTLNASTTILSTGTLTATANPNTVNYNSLTAQTCKVATYYHLTLSGAGAKTCAVTAVSGDVTTAGTATWTLSSSPTISGGLIVGAGTTVTKNTNISPVITGTTTINGTLAFGATTGAFTVGNILIGNGGLMSFSSAAPITLNGNLEVNGTGSISGTTGTWAFQRVGGNGSIYGTSILTSITAATFTTTYTNYASTTIGTLTVTGTNFTTAGTTTVTTSLAGTGSAIQAMNGYLEIKGTSGITGLDASAYGNTVEYKGAAQTIKAPTTGYWNLKLSVSGAKTTATALYVYGDFTLAGSATFTAGTSLTHTFFGNWIIDTSAGTPFSYTTASTMVFNMPRSLLATSITGATTATLGFNNLTLTNVRGFSTTENLNMTGTFSVSKGVTFTPGAAVVINSSGAAGTVSGYGQLQVTRTAATADYSSQYKFSTNSLSTMTVEYAGAGNQTVNSLSYGTLSINAPSQVASLSATTSLAYDLLLKAGTFSAPAGKLYVGRNYTQTSGTFTHNSGTVEMSSPSAAAAGTITVGTAPSRATTEGDCANVGGSTSATTAGFDTSADTLLIATTNADSSGLFGGVGMAISNNGSALTWTRIVDFDRGDGADYYGHVSAWYAVPGVRTGMTVTATQSTEAGCTISLKVYPLTGASLTSPLGSVAWGSSNVNDLTTGTYTSTVDNSLAFAVGTDWTAQGVPGSTDTEDGFTSVGHIAGVSAYKSALTTPVGTSVSLNLDAFGATSPAWTWATFEIVPDPAYPIMKLASSGSTLNNLVINNGILPVAYWKFDETTAGTASDSSVNGYTLTTIGASGVNNKPQPSTNVPTLGFSDPRSLNFDGTDDCASTNSTVDLSNTSVATVAFWGYYPTYSNLQNITLESSADADSNDGTIGISPNNNGGGYTFAIQDSVATGKWLSVKIYRPPVNTWHHYVGVFDNSTAAGSIAVYVDGLATSTSFQLNTKDQSGTFRNYTWYIGCRGGSSRFKDQTIDDLRVYDRALSASDVAALYAATSEVVGGTATTTLSDNPLVAASDVRISSGVFDPSATACSGSPCAITVGRNWANTGGTFYPRTGSVTLNAGSGTKTITSNASSFYNLIFNDGGGSATFELQDALDVLGSLTITGGTLDTKSGGSYPISVAGNWTNSDIFTAQSCTVTFDGGSAQTLSGNMTGSSAFYSLDFTGAGTKSFGSNAASTTANFTIESGSGAVTAPSTRLSIRGDYSNLGTFTHNSGRVYFDGSGTQTILGDTTWYDFVVKSSTARTVNFESAKTQTIATNGSLTFQGAASNLITLAATAAPTKWKLTVDNTGTTQNVSYVSPSYSDASGGAEIQAANGTNSDGGNNINWNVSGLSFTVDSNSKSLGVLTPGVLQVASSTLSVDTNNSSGFSVTVQRDDSDTTMDLDTNAATNITDKTAWSPGVNCASAGNATASTTEPLTLQFRIQSIGTDSGNYCSAWWGTNDASANARLAGFPSTPQMIVSRSTASSPATNSVVLYNINVPASQATGAYSGSVTYTVTANP